MDVLQQRRAMVRLALLAAALTGLSACGDQIAGPQRSGLRASSTANHDDPPSAYCATGWQEEGGIWVCPP
jgi:hypothetical protein